MTMHQPVISSDVCAPSAVRRVAAMLDLGPDYTADLGLLPRGWHFLLLGGATRRSELRSDGFPGLGVPMPDLGLTRLMLAGRSVEYHGDLPVGGTVHRRSHLASVKQKQSANGDMAIVTLHHELALSPDAPPVIIEQQTYILTGPAKTRSKAEPAVGPIAGDRTKVVTPDETLLFQYSALGFNSHRIHINRDYARDVEGLPDLVVNGGLTTLMLTEFLRIDLGLTLSRITTKHLAPLYCGRPLTLTANQDGEIWRLRVHDDRGTIAVDAEVVVQ
jgi:3-methylfumaryl-CoA hydratase